MDNPFDIQEYVADIMEEIIKTQKKVFFLLKFVKNTGKFSKIGKRYKTKCNQYSLFFDCNHNQFM